MNTKQNTDFLKTFPFKSTLTLSNLIGYWQLRAADKEFSGQALAIDIINQLKDNPDFLKPIEDIKILQKNLPLLEKIMSAVFPYALQEDELACVVAPFDLHPFYTTKRFHSLFDSSSLKGKFKISDNMSGLDMNKTLKAYIEILAQLYGIELSMDQPNIVKYEDPVTLLEKCYRLSVNQKFCEIKVIGESPELTGRMIQDLQNNVNDLSMWMKYLPPHHFEFHGIAIVQLIDVTEQEVYLH